MWCDFIHQKFEYHNAFYHYIPDIIHASKFNVELILREIYEHMYIADSDKDHERWKDGS